MSSTIATLLLALAALPQAATNGPGRPTPAPRPEAGALQRGFGPDWIVVDAVAQIVNGDIITVSEILRELERRLEGVPITTVAERIEAERQVQRLLTERALWSQAGDDMGVDPERVENSIDYLLERQREGRGIRSMSSLVQNYGFDKRTEREFVRSELNLGLWRDSVLGRQPGALGRVTHDNYVRPGKLLGLYRDNPELFLEPDLVRLQILVIHAAAWGGEEPARTQTENLRRQLLEGADLGELVEEYGARFRDSRGVSELIEVDRLRDPAWREFAAGAEVGEISPVLEYSEGGERIGFQLVRLVERMEAPPLPPFTDGETQEQLTRSARRRLDDMILGRANQQLYRSSWLWPAVER